MIREYINRHLKGPLALLSKNFIELLEIDLLINIKKIVTALILMALALIFGFSVWTSIINYLARYMISQGFSGDNITLSIMLLNVSGLIACIFFGYRQLNKLQFIYTARAINKIKQNLRQDDDQK